MSIRAEKVASVIKKSLADQFRSLASANNAGLVTVTSVRMSNDLRTARVYFSMMSGKISPGEFIEILEQKSGMLRHEIGRQLKLRATPDLKFFLDDTLEQMDHIRRLLEKAKIEQITSPDIDKESADDND